MARVHFAPNCAVKYMGAKAKDFNTSLARPKPRLVKGDIVIVDKKTAFNLVQKGFGEFESVDKIAFNKAESAEHVAIEELKAEMQVVREEIQELIEENSRMLEINEKLENENRAFRISQVQDESLEDLEKE